MVIIKIIDRVFDSKFYIWRPVLSDDSIQFNSIYFQWLVGKMFNFWVNLCLLNHLLWMRSSQHSRYKNTHQKIHSKSGKHFQLWLEFRAMSHCAKGFVSSRHNNTSDWLKSIPPWLSTNHNSCIILYSLWNPLKHNQAETRETVTQNFFKWIFFLACGEFWKDETTRLYQLWVCWWVWQTRQGFLCRTTSWLTIARANIAATASLLSKQANLTLTWLIAIIYCKIIWIALFSDWSWIRP